MDVAGGVAPAPSPSALWCDQPEPVVLTQCLSVHASEFSRDGDDEDRRVWINFGTDPRHCPHLVVVSLVCRIGASQPRQFVPQRIIQLTG